MKKNHRAIFHSGLVAVLWLLLGLASLQAYATPVALSDSQLGDVTGQALIYTNVSNSNGLTFYTVGLDSQIALNANIQKLQLGCGGTNGLGNCDIDIDNFQLTGTPGVGSCASGTTVLAACDLIMKRPAITFAIANDNTPSRSVVGLQLGAQTFQGTLGFGQINTFSGYLTGSAAVTMQAASNVALTCLTGSCTGTAQSTNCGGNGCSGGTTPNGVSYYATNPTIAPTTLGLKDDYACGTFIFTICAAFDGLTIDTTQQTASGVITLSGNRQTQAQVTGLNLGTLTENVTSSLTFNQSRGLPSWLLNAIKGLVVTSAELAIENQMGAALTCNQATVTTCPSGITPQTANCTNSTYNCVGTGSSEPAQAALLNQYIMPYNVSALHQVAVNSNAFALSFQKQSVTWPGQSVAMNTGWTMYMPNSFTLPIDDPLSTFTSNIVSGAASAGNIAPLPGLPQNCFGSAHFC